MPIFDYTCPSCTNQFERIVKTADQEVLCYTCGTITTKQLSRPAGHVVYGGELNRYTTGKSHKYVPKHTVDN